MELHVAKKLIQNKVDNHAYFISQSLVAERYYRVENDILFRDDKRDEVGNPMRNADNRVPHSFYQLLVNQKAGYIMTAPPVFDVGDEKANELIVEALGDNYEKYSKDLCVNASNSGVAWLHYWRNEENKFEWGVVPSTQVIPIYDGKLESHLLAVLRVYDDIDTSNGHTITVYEYWTDKQCETYCIDRGDSDYRTFRPYMMFTDFYIGGMTGASNVYEHGLGDVPFIEFRNNNLMSNDLTPIKQLIDAYDKTYSGFVNDLEDIQEVIFVLTNYGGENLNEFLSDMKYYKTIQMDSVGADDKSGVSTLNIDIPVEARDKMLAITRKSIFDMGQGIDPQQQGLDGTSGEAMKFLYALLELKAGMLETEFKRGYNRFIRSILRFYGKECGQIIQTWTRTSIRNDSELVDMCAKSNGIVSQKTILKNHPFVENADYEIKQLEEEDKAQQEAFNSYKDTGLHD